jgi:hypothetical protein
MTVNLQTLTADQKALFRAGFAAAYPDALKGRSTFIVIAAADSPDYVKARADYVCSGTADNVLIQTILDGLPKISTVDGANNTTTTGGKGALQFAEGHYNLTDRIIIRAGSAVSFWGTSLTPWIPVNIVTRNADGGTYFTGGDAQGRQFYVEPNAQNFPATYISLRSIEFRPMNPATYTASAQAVDLVGMVTGDAQDINVIADMTVNATSNIGRGFVCAAGGACDKKYFRNISACNFRLNGVLLNTTHFLADGIFAGNISGDAFSCCIGINAQDDNSFRNLHAFSGTYGISIAASSGISVYIDSVHLESITNPFLVDSPYLVEVNRLNLDTGVIYKGDVVGKVRVNFLHKKDDKAKRAMNFGYATMASGATTVSWPHGLLVSPGVTTFSGTTTSGTKNITAITGTPVVGMPVSGPGIPAGASLTSYNSGAASGVISVNATASAAITITQRTGSFNASPQGDLGAGIRVLSIVADATNVTVTVSGAVAADVPFKFDARIGA